MEVLFEGLVSSFGLAIGLRVVSGGEVELHVEERAERPEELRRKFGTTVAGYMERDTVFGEYMV